MTFSSSFVRGTNSFASPVLIPGSSNWTELIRAIEPFEALPAMEASLPAPRLEAFAMPAIKPTQTTNTNLEIFIILYFLIDFTISTIKATIPPTVTIETTIASIHANSGIKAMIPIPTEINPKQPNPPSLPSPFSSTFNFNDIQTAMTPPIMNGNPIFRASDISSPSANPTTS